MAVDRDSPVSRIARLAVHAVHRSTVRDAPSGRASRSLPARLLRGFASLTLAREQPGRHRVAEAGLEERPDLVAGEWDKVVGVVQRDEPAAALVVEVDVRRADVAPVETAPGTSLTVDVHAWVWLALQTDERSGKTVADVTGNADVISPDNIKISHLSIPILLEQCLSRGR